ncbi:membrane protein [Streptomyces hygroscopicus subsp. sporocinereus]|uniref:Membrane protein n=1 Tax=Streptomyces hygroscopicus TaxID=1912 RepID=A0ABQ3U031_STRHY|nr:hypothetical protein [Streptomyces hygroscopicus]GHJ28976.1 membrane protein [Streptomyces hygroscopicus]
MSTEDTDTPQTPDDDTPRPRRRTPLAVVSVAAAVLVAGGGGAYWASTAADGGTRGPGAAGEDGAPKPLALDAYASPSGERDGNEGIAPGEPDPRGGRYVIKGELPDGPEEAPVYLSDPKVTKADVARLAKALDVSGSPRADHGYWKVGGTKDAGGPTLRVSRTGPGSWSYARYGAPGGTSCVHPDRKTADRGARTDKGDQADGGDQADKGDQAGKGDKSCPSYRDGDKRGEGGADEGGDKAVSEEKAERAAEPVLKALGLPDAKLDARSRYGAVRMVNADPTVGGLPTHGWGTSLQVGADGQLVGGSGTLSMPKKGDSYPLLGAEQALRRLNTTTAAKDGGGSGKVTVRKATFGLASHLVDGRRALVPSWIFETEPTGTNRVAVTVPYPAVKPEFIKKAEEPGHSPSTPPGEGDGTSKPDDISSYRVDGKTLTVRFWGGVCNTYSASAKETSERVTLELRSKPTHPGRACILVAKEMETKVTLKEPLDGRKVVDGSTGETVPRRK